jgi:hypothetical protein
LPSAGPVTGLSSDPFTNTSSQHRTEVEPDTLSSGSTIVAAFQVGRFFDGGSSDIGWATSTNSGASWSNGLLIGITKFQGAGPYDRVSDPSVGYDARDHTWLIASLALSEQSGGVTGPAVVVSRSTDGGLTWSAGPVVAATGTDLDKDWIVCDNTASSPYYGNCYLQYDSPASGNALHLTTSANGGQTWNEAVVPSTSAIGGQPLVQPNGHVIVPLDSGNESTVQSVTSNDGGATYGAPVPIASIASHDEAGSLRSSPLPSAEVDAAGKIYVVWQDCRFRSACASNDIVMSTSTDGSTWSPVARIPIDATTSSADHFIPGLAVDATTSGNSAHLALTYYYYPSAGCTASSCQLDVGFLTSTDGGISWGGGKQVAGPISLGWLPNTNQGVMVGDYISTSFSGSTAHPAAAVARVPAGSVLDEAMYTTASGLATAGGGLTSTGERPLVTATARPAASLRTRR